MYCITDQHIDFVLNDIRRNGIETEDLQLNLLDHICCLAEHSLEDGDDFEAFYYTAIKQFYHKELREIEVETTQMLTFKNYYMMKKIMLAGGFLSVLAFLTGSLFKVMHYPGAGAILTLGILLISFFFLPLVFILKAKEVNTGLEKLTVALGTLLGILFCLDILFTVNHWPGATMLWYSTISLSIFVFIPLYTFTGTRKPETRTNTILTTIVLIGFTGLLFTNMNLRSSAAIEGSGWNSYQQNEEILHKVTELTASKPAQANNEVQSILVLSDQIKTRILELSTGTTSAPANTGVSGLDFRQEALKYMGDYFRPGGEGVALLRQLQAAMAKYEEHQKLNGTPVAPAYSFLKEPGVNVSNYDNLYVLNSITQLQIYLVTSGLTPAGKTVAQR